MTKPGQNLLFAALDATWPPARIIDRDGWRLREGLGGGQRVSAATALEDHADISDGERGMRALGQHPLFMVRPGEEAIDSKLAKRGYDVVDPVTLYLVPTADIAQAQPAAITMLSWPPLAVQRELWGQAGISEARIAVMERATEPKTAILCRSRDIPAGVVFVAIDDDIAMLHALEVSPTLQRQGLGEMAVRAVADWAQKHGARWLTLAVTQANTAANALYHKLKMEPVTSYHYRRAPGVTT
ncbi:MAG: GNAT family N-acetyltransferase [Silicimonas sp.]|nr:GNAT family N-acetyltransferase [Silicimonas sp.]